LKTAGRDAASGRLRRDRAVKRSAPPKSSRGAREMLDIVFIAGGLAFFAMSIGYTLICERL
jgi:hypothetical protein